jgi:hypothetical protein
MPILVLVASDEAVAKATKEAVELNVPLNQLLQERFSEFLLGDRKPAAKAKAAKASDEIPEPNEHQQVVNRLVAYAQENYAGCGEFTFTQLVGEFDPEETIDKQSRTKYASMFSKATEGDVGVVKKGKNSKQVTVYEVA